MMLSNQQKYIVSVLRQLKYMRMRQLHAMVQEHYRTQGIEIGKNRMELMLHQLKAISNHILVQGDLVLYGTREISVRHLEAVDVMLELTENAPAFYSCEGLHEPFLLRFSGSGDMLNFLFSVTWMDIPGRVATTSRMKGERIIWISDRVDTGGIILPRHHFFAARQENGTHRFFGSAESKKI